MGIRGKVGGDYETPEAGLHKARCIKIIDKGTHYNEKFSNEQRELNIMFEMPELLMKKGDNDGKPFAISLGFGGSITLSMNAKSNLRPIIVGWMGKALDDKEAAEFNIDSLIGRPALLQIIHTTKDENTYANISQVLPLKEAECPAPVNKPVVFSISEFDQRVFDSLPENTRKRIEECNEWAFRHNPVGEIGQAEARARKETSNAVTDVPEDEIPFSTPDNEIAQETQTKTDKIDIEAIGKEGARGLIDFEAEFKKLPKKTWSAVNELCKRKMGDSDYKSFFSVGEWGNPDTDDYSPEVQATICKELITVCKARE